MPSMSSKKEIEDSVPFICADNCPGEVMKFAVKKDKEQDKRWDERYERVIKYIKIVDWYGVWLLILSLFVLVLYLRK